MAAKRETAMSAGEGQSGGGVNLMPETRVIDWILSDSDEGPSSGKEERAGEGAAKWASGVPHDDGEASSSESHFLFTCSIDGA
jgi:hypothetical protein